MLNQEDIKAIAEEEVILSIKEIAYRIKSCVEIHFTSVKIQGEISGYKQHTSGHHYFALKDEDAVLDAICWRGTRLATPIQEGQEVIAIGRITTYPMRSKYQIIIEQILPKGQGALQTLLKERMAYYQKKGYFDHKKSLPKFPKIIGVITSETGAVIRDILHRIADRYPLHVLLWPVQVQGVGAKEQIALAIDGFNKLTIHKPDILIVGRGGGSLEDLWAFNEPEVLEATFRSIIPVISAVGHETDMTLLDYVADKRAPTPTAAAEMAVPSRLDIVQDLGQWGNRLLISMTHHIKNKILKVQAMNLISPQKIVENWTMRLDDLSLRYDHAMRKLFENKIMILLRFSFQPPKINLDQLNRIYDALYLRVRHVIERKKQNLLMSGALLEQSSIEKTLQRGFCIPLLSNGSVVRYSDLKLKDVVDLRFYEGVKKVVVA